MPPLGEIICMELGAIARRAMNTMARCEAEFRPMALLDADPIDKDVSIGYDLNVAGAADRWPIIHGTAAWWGESGRQGATIMPNLPCVARARRRDDAQ